MNKDEFLSRLKDPEKFKLQLQALAIDNLYEFTNLLYDNCKDADPTGEVFCNFETIDYAITLYIDILSKSAKGALEHVIRERKWQMENK